MEESQIQRLQPISARIKHMNSTPLRFNWPMAATFVAVAFLGLATFFGFKVVDVLRPKVTVNERTLVSTAFGELKKRAKLVVLTAKVSALVETENEVSSEVLGVSIPRGKTKVLVRSPNNRVQYVIPLEALNESNFQFDANLCELTVTLPHPVADRDLVEIDPLPEVRTDVGWFRTDSRSGEKLRNEAKGMIRDSVLREAANAVYRGAARDAGREAALTLLAPAVARIPGNVHLRIEFGDLPKQPGG